MERDDLDRLLSEEDIVPSSGFVARVMDAVRVEAAAPPAIPFPWSRALPGMIAVAVALAATIAGFFTPGSTADDTVTSLTTIVGASSDLTWMLVVLLLSGVPVVWSLRMTRGPS